MSGMKVSEYIVKFLHDKGIDTVFGYSGGAITHIMDSLNRSKDVGFIQTYHEQTAAIAAEGYSWKSKNIGAAIATSGPGAMNLITGIADAYFDSIPVLFITGQVNTFEYKGKKPIRQQGFQETDIVSIVKPITKYSNMVANASRIRYELEKAFSIAKEGRCGPVLLDIPMDVQRDMVEERTLDAYVPELTSINNRKPNLGQPSRDLVIKMITGASRPILLLGGGVASSDAKKHVLKFAQEFHLPVVVSLLGKGTFPEDNPLFIGMIGSYGNRCANMALANADVAIVLGARMDTRQTGTNISSFVRAGRILRVDIDENEIYYHRLENVVGIVSDIKDFIEELTGLHTNADGSKWMEYIWLLKKKYSQDVEIEKNIENRRPYFVMDLLNRFASEGQIYTVDVGQNQMFAAQQIRVKARQEWKTSGGLAPMGFAVPAAIGASFADGRRANIYSVVGDGGLHMCLQSLMLLGQYNLPIKVILLNNRSLGMITQFQDLYFDSRKEGTTSESGYLVPDFRYIAKAYDINYHLISGDAYNDQARLNSAFLEEGPSIIEFDVGEDTIVFPKLEVGRPIEDISPRLQNNELKSSMLINLAE